MTRQRIARVVFVAGVALLVTCGQSLAGPRLHTITLDGARVRSTTEALDSQWFPAFAAADVDLDGDDELLAFGDGAVGFMQADGHTTPLLEVSADAGLWVPDAAGERADLFVWNGGAFGWGDDATITYASCDLGARPVCSALGTQELEGPINTLAAGDFDEDGLVDFVTSSEVLTVYLSAGADGPARTWVEQASSLVETSPGTPNGVASADLDGDGHLDLVAAAGRLGVRLFFGNGDGTFGQVRPDIDDAIAGADAVYLTDLDHDTLPEIVVVTDSSDVLVLRRLRHRTFGDAALPLPPNYSESSTREVMHGDFDGDGRDELLIMQGADSVDAASLAALDGQPRAWTMTRLEGDLDDMRVVISSVVADLDGDGRDDLVEVIPQELALECAVGGARARG